MLFEHWSLLYKYVGAPGGGAYGQGVPAPGLTLPILLILLMLLILLPMGATLGMVMVAGYDVMLVMGYPDVIEVMDG